MKYKLCHINIPKETYVLNFLQFTVWELTTDWAPFSELTELITLNIPKCFYVFYDNSHINTYKINMKLINQRGLATLVSYFKLLLRTLKFH